MAERKKKSKRTVMSEYEKDIIEQCRDPEFAAAYLLQTLRGPGVRKTERIATVLGRIAMAYIPRRPKPKKAKRGKQ